MADLVITEKQNLVSIADAIREKAGLEDDFLFPDGFMEAISGLEVGGDIEGYKFASGSFTPANDITSTYSLDVSSIPLEIDRGSHLVVIFQDPHNYNRKCDAGDLILSYYFAGSYPSATNAGFSQYYGTGYWQTSVNTTVSKTLVANNAYANKMDFYFTSTIKARAGVKYTWFTIKFRDV